MYWKAHIFTDAADVCFFVFIFWFENCFSSIQISLTFFQGSSSQWVSIEPDNGLVLNRWQAIIWTNDGLILWHICVPQPRWVHDDVIKWKHFPRYWPFVRGIHRSSVNSPHKGQWRGALMFSSIWTSTNGLANNRGAGDLRRRRAHHDVIVMWIMKITDCIRLLAYKVTNRLMFYIQPLTKSWWPPHTATGYLSTLKINPNVYLCPR